GVTPSSARISLGESADFTLSLSGDGSLADPVTVSCGKLPSGTRCTFSRNRIKATDLPVAVTLTVFTTPLVAAAPGWPSAWRWPGVVLCGAALTSLTLMALPVARRKNWSLLASLALLCALGLGGCTGLLAPTNRGSFTATVTGTSGKIHKSTDIKLTLQ